MQQNVILTSPADTSALAEKIASRIKGTGIVITLRGDLGVGKTAFAKAFINHLSDIPQEVVSPTFTLIQEYDTGRGGVSHIDLYRLQDAKETVEIGLEEIVGHSAITLIEWPEIIEAQLPGNRIDIYLSYAEASGGRTARIVAGEGMLDAEF